MLALHVAKPHIKSNLLSKQKIEKKHVEISRVQICSKHLPKLTNFNFFHLQERKLTTFFLGKFSKRSKVVPHTWKDLTHYKSYFHDGSITGFEQNCDKLSILMESAEILNLDFAGHLKLSTDNRLKGRLHLETALEVCIDDQPTSEKLRMLADSATILDFALTANRVEFFIEWTNYPPNKKITLYSDIKIKAQNIFWVNDS